MRASVVRSNQPGCEPHCAEWIALQGAMYPGTLARVRDVITRLGSRKLPVLIDSPGGAVEDAMAIGRLVRERHLDVAVSKSIIDPCGPKDASCRRREPTGMPIALRSRCASACVLVLAAGTDRYVGFGTFLGVHQMVVRRTMTRVLRRFRILSRMIGGKRIEISRTLIGVTPVSSFTTQTSGPAKLYDKVGPYLSDMGIGPELIALMGKTPASGIHWMSMDEIRRTKIATSFEDGEDVIAGLNARPTPAPAPPPDARPAAPPNKP